ncbi:hypothetical protein [Rothia kristinae]|uniref:hypothetical protein n=1 Tax=Rothia kristinae TaxID=37923 RepID=UPI00119F6B42|nr:hypothetical protein [Rothia kristinae]
MSEPEETDGTPAELDQEQDTLEILLQEATDRLLNHDDRITGTEDFLTQLGAKVGDLDETLTWVIEKITQKPTSLEPVPWNWRAVDGEQRQHLWQVVRSFVDWVNDRYFQDSWDGYIPGCWYRHPRAVEELTAVWAAWHSAYHAASSPNESAAYWHDRILWPTLERLENGWADCRKNGHQQMAGSRIHVTDDGFEDAIAAEDGASAAPSYLEASKKLLKPEKEDGKDTVPGEPGDCCTDRGR